MNTDFYNFQNVVQITLVTDFWMSEMESKRRPFKWDFTFGNKK